VDDREAQPPAGSEDARRLADGAGAVVHVVDRHERDDEPEG